MVRSRSPCSRKSSTPSSSNNASFRDDIVKSFRASLASDDCMIRPLTMTFPLHKNRGFTLIEILLVIGIIGVLSVIVVISVNPTRQLGQARDVKRKSDVYAILNAVYHYRIANNGTRPGCLADSSFVDNAEYRICKSAANPVCDIDAMECTLSGLSGAYLVELPIDPQEPSASRMTGYSIWKAYNGRITVTASGEVIGASSAGYTKPQITVTR